MEVKNAKITSTSLGYEDHGVFTFYLHLDYGGAGQGAGGYVLDRHTKKNRKRTGTKMGMDLIIAILRLLKVGIWEDLPGTYVKAKMTHDKVIAIAPIFADNERESDWLDFGEFFSEQKT